MIYLLSTSCYSLHSVLCDLPSKLYQLLSTLYVLYATIYSQSFFLGGGGGGRGYCTVATLILTLAILYSITGFKQTFLIFHTVILLYCQNCTPGGHVTKYETHFKVPLPRGGLFLRTLRKFSHRRVGTFGLGGEGGDLIAQKKYTMSESMCCTNTLRLQ